MSETKDLHIKPQDGFQKKFLESQADVVIGGGAAGAGKSFALLVESLRYTVLKPKENFGGIIFRRTYPEIMRQGGLWDESKKIYPNCGAIPVQSKAHWRFPNGSKISFSHLQYEKDLDAFQGAQIPFIAFDELTHFTSHMFFYLLSRNRSTIGIKPYIRATCNPDPDSWVAEFIKWWINQETGFPIPERDGVLRYFVRDGSNYIWGNSKREVYDKAKHILNNPMFKGIKKKDLIKSVTFIAGDIQHNKELLKINPAYLANLLAQDEDTQLRLLKGNWKIRTDNTSLFDPFAISDLWTNDYRPKGSDLKYIVIDHARFGKDFCVIGTWIGWYCARIDILPQSATDDITKVVQELRQIYRGIPMSQVIIDQDGIGVKDNLGCRIFMPAGTAHDVDRKKQYYKNRRAQMYFRLSDQVNNRDILVNADNVWFRRKGETALQVNNLKIGGQTYTIKELIKDDLRTIKRENEDFEQRKRITSKDTQKEILGRSPDFSDMLAIRCEFEFIKQPKGLTRR